MIFFITFLRALAACLITNAHYTGIYPTDLIANGGLIGDILFFAISGYCLYNARGTFVKWYGKRLYRVYPPVVLITAIYAITGFYNVTGQNCVGWFLYPTHYHFVASIVILYIPFYFVMKSEWLKSRLLFVMAVIAGIWLAYYFVIYDKSYYHIDSVYEPMIRVLFFEAMLLGAYFRQKDGAFRNFFRWRNIFGVSASFVVYFASKLIFSRIEEISHFQFLNQIIIFILLYFIFRTFAGLDAELEQLPAWLKKIIQMISAMTLEIYLVQYVLIDELREFAFFPVNWLILTGTILLSAWLLHTVCEILYHMFEVIGLKIKRG